MLTDQSRSHLIFDSSQPINRNPSVTINGVSCAPHPSSFLESAKNSSSNQGIFAQNQSATRTSTTASTTNTTGATTAGATGITSVKKVICELEASFGRKNLSEQQEQHLEQRAHLSSPIHQGVNNKVTINAPSSRTTTAILPFSLNSNNSSHLRNNTSVKQPLLLTTSSSSTQDKSPNSSVKTQTEREAPESLTPSPEAKRLVLEPNSIFKTRTSMIPLKTAMESDSSCHHHHDHQEFIHQNKNHHRRGQHHHHQHPVKSSLVTPLTTVSVSTCPSCGSENVSSESMPSSAATKRSLSFQHLIQDKHHGEVTTTSSGDCHGQHHHPSKSSKLFQKKILTSTPLVSAMNHQNVHRHKPCHANEPGGIISRSKSFSYNLLMPQEESTSSSCLTCKGCDCDFVPSQPKSRIPSNQHILPSSNRKKVTPTTTDPGYSSYFDRNGKKLRRKKTTRITSSNRKVQDANVFEDQRHRQKRPSYLSLYPDQNVHLYNKHHHPSRPYLLPPPPSSSKLPSFLPMMPPVSGYCPYPECEASLKYDPLEKFLRRNSNHFLNQPHHHHPHRHHNVIDRSRSFHVTTGNPELGSKLNNYRFWDIDDWRAQVRRQKVKRKERRTLLTVCVVGIIVFIAVSYFGTLLFLRITKFPTTSSLHSDPRM